MLTAMGHTLLCWFLTLLPGKVGRLLRLVHSAFAEATACVAKGFAGGTRTQCALHRPPPDSYRDWRRRVPCVLSLEFSALCVI